MKVSVLASGSKGNCTYFQTEQTKNLIDIGMSTIYVEEALKDLGINPREIDNIFITHTHIDHIAGLKVFVKKYHPTIYMTKKMYEELSKSINITNYVIADKEFKLLDLNVKTFKTSHDIESLGYVFNCNNRQLVYITDTGYISNKNHELLQNKDVYVIESNHDIQMLMDNEKYPYHIKQRILSDKGHLSNYDSANYLSQFLGDRTSKIVLIHLSESNNTDQLALQTVTDRLKDYQGKIIISYQDKKTELIEV